MNIIVNDKKYNSFEYLLEDPAIKFAQDSWGVEGVYEKSSIPLSIFKTPFGSISLLFGPRQIGKTASLKLFLTQCSDSETLIFTDCSTILEKSDLAAHVKNSVQGQTTLILDEVQEVKGWHLALRSLYSEGILQNCRIWCTGSEARYLLESGERLPGRKGLGRTVFARPWSFREYMNFFHLEVVQSLQSVHFLHVNQLWLESQTLDLSPYWQEYLISGGIPRAVAEQQVKKNISDFTWQTYVDWILGTWSKQRTPARSLAGLAKRLCETMNSRVSFEALRKGTDIQSLNTVKALLEMQEDHFSIKTISRFDPQTEKFLPAKQKKIFPIDPFIARVWMTIGWNIRRLYEEKMPEIHMDECAFFAQLHRREEENEVSYLYSEKTQSEIDFFFQGCAFELKSNGKPTANQFKILNQCKHAFVVRKKNLPIVAYLIGEDR